MSRAKVRVATAATALNAAATILPQLVALVLLSAADYGRFSMVYLVQAAGVSTVFSFICDAWSRTSSGHTPEVGWRDFSSALGRFSALFGVPAVIIAALVGFGWSQVVLAGIAVVALTYRTGSRYYESHVGEWRQVVAGDFVNIAGSVVGLLIGLLAGWDVLGTTLLVWAMGSAASVVASKRPSLTVRRALRRWWAEHRRTIMPLLSDSLLLDAGAIGTPYIVAPLLGLAGFGVYRAVSNVATPVQLILNPLRPLITGSRADRLLSPRLLGPLTIILALAAIAAYAVIVALPRLPIRLGVLSDLHVVALPAALFVLANGLSFYVYLVARGHAPASRIFPSRMVQTLLAIAAPVIGAWVWGLQGAVWGFTGSAFLFIVIWWMAIAWPARAETGLQPREGGTHPMGN